MLPTIDEALNKKRELLKIKRKLLFKEFSDHPNDLHFALEIKALDDQIVEYTWKIEQSIRKPSVPTL